MAMGLVYLIEVDRVRCRVRIMFRIRVRFRSQKTPDTDPTAELVCPERLSGVHKGGCWSGLAFD